MENDVAFVVFHESVDEEPFCMVAGEAESVHVGAGGDVCTTTVAPQVTFPPAPFAVPVYVVE